jgi:hypothetical protein
MTKQESATKATAPRVVGTAVITALSKVKPNTWNPNRMTPFIRDALKHGLEVDGWLASQALLIWGTDETGKDRNIIIDGEHRFVVASELGFKKGPMVFLHKLTEAQAKALTVKMNQKRGAWDETLLADLVKEIQFDVSLPDLGLDLGLEQDDLMALLAEIAVPLDNAIAPSPRGPVGGNAGMPTSNVRMVQLFLDETTHGEFSERIRQLAAAYGTKTVTDTTLEAVRRADTTASVKG